MLSAKKDGITIASIAKSKRSTDHALFLTLGKDNTFLIRADTFKN